MSNGARLRRLTLHETRISDKTRWIFLQVDTQDGRTGWGEATLNGREAPIRASASAIAQRLLHWSPGRPESFAQSIAPANLDEAAVISAIDHALWDLHAAGSGQPLAQALGGICRESIPIYANINRRTEVRTPQGFAQSARIALDAGFSAVKLAPFDEVGAAHADRIDAGQALQAGLDRISAVRAVIGPEGRLMIDCHWRFGEEGACRLIDAAADFAPYWIECPLPEIDTNIEALVRLRKRANARGVRLAGLEQGVGLDAFLPYCKAGAYDVMMPDVKYVGGLREMLRCASVLSRCGVEVSLHNPTGPISHAASLHISAAARHIGTLETQFDESPLFDGLVSGLPLRTAGQSPLPMAPGLGVRIAAGPLAAHAARPACVWEAS